MKLTLGQVANEGFLESLVELSKVKSLSPKYKWDLDDSFDIISDKLKHFEKSKNDIIFSIDPSGTVNLKQLPKEKIEEFYSKMDELGAIEFEVPVEKVKLKLEDFSNMSTFNIRSLKGVFFDRPEG